MCGRARCTLRAHDVPRACHLNNAAAVPNLQFDRYRPSYNVAPGSYLPVVRRQSDGAVVECMKWGLIPSFTSKNQKPDHYKMFNARSESLREKPSFGRLLHGNRCLVAVEGFYEWRKDGSRKQPYYIHLKDGRPLVFAALYDTWKNSEGEVIHTFTIVTTSSSSALQWLHDRMPVILGDKASADAWLNGPSDSKLDMLLKPYEELDLVWYPVTPTVGKPSFNGPECIKEVPLKSETKQISNFFTKKEAGHSIVNTDDKKPENNCAPKHPLLTEETKKDKSSQKDSAETNLSTREETETETETKDKAGYAILVKDEHDLCLLSPNMQEDEHISSMKRKHEVSPPPKLTLEKFDEIYALPGKKSGKVKTSEDKQPTLLSFFKKR